jgi:hypothetical protein
VTLLTDTQMIIRDRANNIIETHDLLYGVALPQPDKQWIWTLAPRGFEHPDNTREHLAQGHVNLQK